MCQSISVLFSFQSECETNGGENLWNLNEFVHYVIHAISGKKTFKNEKFPHFLSTTRIFSFLQL